MRPETAFWRVAMAALLAVSLALPATAIETVSPISGVFGNVTLSYETGDLGGLEIEFHTGSSDKSAIIVFCEGWCNQAYQVPVNLSGDSFSLMFEEGADKYQVEGRMIGRELVVNLWLNDYKWEAKLVPLQARFGLNVAAPPVTGDN